MSFQPPPLTRERISVLLRALRRKGGEMKARDLNRLNGVEWWEIDQAEELGCITKEKRKPRTGRPSQWAKLAPNQNFQSSLGDSGNAMEPENVSKICPTELLPYRADFERPISYKEWDFALLYALGDFAPDLGPYGFRRRGWSAYLKAYPSCNTKAAARSSASRLLQRPQVKAAIAWQFAVLDRLPEIHRFFPRTSDEVWNTLHHLASYRTRWAPWSIQVQWSLKNADHTTRGKLR
jgi:hypothetical protein